MPSTSKSASPSQDTGLSDPVKPSLPACPSLSGGGILQCVLNKRPVLSSSQLQEGEEQEPKHYAQALL